MITVINNMSFWVENPRNLNFLRFWPCLKATNEQNANSITVLIIYISIITAIVTKTYTPLYMGVLGVAMVSMFYYTYFVPQPVVPQPPVSLEPMRNMYYGPEVNGPQNLGVEPKLRRPTPNNPFMNVNVTDYDKPQEFKNYNRYKEAVYPTPQTEEVRLEVKDDFIDGLFQDPSGKIFDRQNSQREYVSQPVGGVPSRQNEFAQWLYGKPHGTCKSSSIYDRYGVDVPEQLLCTGYNSSQPTNGGIKEKYV
jgi:hypothetical protein